MEATVLNPIQLQLLQMFSYQKKEAELEEMRDVLLTHLRAKCDEESKRIWEEKGMSNELMNEWLNTHMRTPYNR
ncbi:hypothetical protein FACS18947_3740 [Bacteroidia bacterium]|nr:hypothetical protein FACS18947_3740 [Bacteroidia bacterium]